MRIVTILKKRNKKGSLFDFLDILPIIFTGALMTVISIFLFRTLVDNGVFTTTPESSIIGNGFVNNVIPTLDFFIIAMFIGLFLGSIVLTFALPSNPSLFWLNIALLFIVVILSVVLSNTYEFVTASPSLSQAVSDTTMATFFFSNLPIIASVYSVVLIMVMLGLKKREAIEMEEF
tara:strand:+ start:136 stop:663 length:528 start_codon:yes stop_codon:yes gene_type:complete